ncbi:hypothetical protein QQG74_00095 [Micromonospora sp. FIMYZ51]|uniref:hypothetical protein n=1 Tax=Micromonospora sp. FIMYZ51 TaxID=3051832 RepID=UPI00311FD3D6
MSTRRAWDAQQITVLIQSPGGPLRLVTDPEDCGLCHQWGEVQVWNPTIRDSATHEQTPPAERIWKIPCPVCRNLDFNAWEAPL